MCSIALGTTQITTHTVQNIPDAAMTYARNPSTIFVLETENQLKNQLKQTSAPQHDLGKAARNLLWSKISCQHACLSMRATKRKRALP